MKRVRLGHPRIDYLLNGAETRAAGQLLRDAQAPLAGGALDNADNQRDRQ